MAERHEERLREEGVDAVAAARLAALLAEEADDGTAFLLRAGVAAARDPELLVVALPVLLEAVEADADDLDRYERGVLFHLRGLAAWRLDRDVPASTRALNRSVALLTGTEEPRTASYAGRVFDTLGQLLHHQGLLTDAREEFERALALKQAAGDVDGAALTLGNLGRLCMELGDFEAAVAHLGRDLEHVEATAPELTRLRAQLLTQLGICRTALGDVGEARRLLDASHALAAEGEDPVGLAFAAVYLGRLALHAGDVEEAARREEEARALLPGLPEGLSRELGALTQHLGAEVAHGRGDLGGALERFQTAAAAFEAASRVSPVEMAEFLQTWAEACVAQGLKEEAAGLLRQALRHLDATTAEGMRNRLDARLRAVGESAWMLHSTGRFVGHAQIEMLLSEAGQAGFRGREEDVTVLFSDIRGFTTISERLAPDVLVSVLNRYLGHMTRCVERYGGMVDKFIGDAVMAVFSLPRRHADDPDRAVAAALYMEAELERFNRSLPDDLPRLRAGVGLHAGRVVAGLIGSPQKRSYTVIGDAVNTASRLEGMTKMIGVPVLVSQSVVDGLAHPDRWLLVPFGAFRPKGRQGAVRVYHVAGEQDGSAEARQVEQRIEATREALAAFEGGDFRRAREAFRQLGEAVGAGTGAAGYALLGKAAGDLARTPPEGDWDGSIELTEK